VRAALSAGGVAAVLFDIASGCAFNLGCE